MQRIHERRASGDKKQRDVEFCGNCRVYTGFFGLKGCPISGKLAVIPENCRKTRNPWRDGVRLMPNGGVMVAFMTSQGHSFNAQAQQPDSAVETMYEYGYRKSNYGPDELVTDAHGNPISVVDAMMKAEDASKQETVTPHLCFYSPRIPGNTGSAIRLCAVTGTILHLVEPLGFNLQDTKLRRAGLDYHDMAHVVLHPNFESLVKAMPNSRIIAFTANATKLYTEVQYRPTDILMFGPEPGNIPDPMDIMTGPDVAEQVRLPMRPSLRSLNLTNCASIAVYEAWRQLGFKGGDKD